jgi:uncharacterized protein (DUF1697 family)
MIVYVALLRAVNVGGTGKLPMEDLRRLCGEAGLRGATTYIASGNVVFVSEAGETEVKRALEGRLLHHAGKPVGVLVRNAAEIAAVLAANPFPDAAPSRNVVIFLDEAPAADALATIAGRDGEELRLGRREIYVHYGSGMGSSKLQIPAAKTGTARNMNTVARLANMAAERQPSRP